MRCTTWLAALCWSSLLPTAALAQDATEQFGDAERKLAAGDCEGAAALLLAMPTTSDAERQRVANLLVGAAWGMSQAGRFEQALHTVEALLQIFRTLHPGADDFDVAVTTNNLGYCLYSLGRPGEALQQYEAALAMHRRLCSGDDHPEVAVSLNNVAMCLRRLGRAREALPLLEETRAMRQRLADDADDLGIVNATDNLGVCLYSLGRFGEALAHHETALAMHKRLLGDRDDPVVAASLGNIASCLAALGRRAEALERREAAFAMRQSLSGGIDDPRLANALGAVASCLLELGRPAEALPRYEAGLAMRRRLSRDSDHAGVATALHNLAYCLESLGRAAEALPKYEASLAMRKRLFGSGGHEDVAASMNNLAYCLQTLGRTEEALPLYEEALAMHLALYGNTDHLDIAMSLNNLGLCLGRLGRSAEAMARHEAALAMSRRLCGEADHPYVATSINNVAACLTRLGRRSEATSQYEAALAMRRRLLGDIDHADIAQSLNNLAGSLADLGRTAEALPLLQRAVRMVESLRDDARVATPLRQSYFDDLKRAGSFERLQQVAAQLGMAADAMQAAERSRGRALLDQIEQQRFDANAEAELRARQRGDETTGTRLRELRVALETRRAEGDRLLHELTQLAEGELTETERAVRRSELAAQSKVSGQRLRELLDERARLLGDVLPVGRVRTPAEIQSALHQGELLLEFTVTPSAGLVYVLGHDGEVEALPVPDALATVEQLLDAVVQQASGRQITDGRGREPGTAPVAEETMAASRALFDALIPKALWPRLQACKRVFLAPHRALHRLPFELLVTGTKDGNPQLWIDDGPAISYVPSGCLLHWLRRRAAEATDDATSLDLLAVGDPRASDVAPEPPEQGVFVVGVDEGGEGARVGLSPGDVLLAYDGQPLADDKALRDQRHATEVAIEDGKRAKTTIPIMVWRHGEELEVQAKHGVLGIQVAPGSARAAQHAASTGVPVPRAGDLDRLRKLPPLRGARAETEAIAGVFAAGRGKTNLLLGAAATEPAVFELAAKAKYLHFACHGIAEEYAGQSLSMLVLSQPQRVLPVDDGLLKLDDLLDRWRSRLSSCRLVVLSACRTNVGPTFRDEAPQALPIGFLFAGAPAVISSLWAVDDASTRELMTDFYGRLMAGERDRLAAFTAAKRALRARHPDPFHWAPFLYIGSPE